MLYGLVIFIHIVTCLILIAVILLQAGRGGGLSEAFGGESSQTIFGTKASVFLTRATVGAASLFLITSLLLGIMTSRRGRSLIELERRKAPPSAIPLAPVEVPETQKSVDTVIDTEDLPLAEPENIPEK